MTPQRPEADNCRSAATVKESIILAQAAVSFVEIVFDIKKTIIRYLCFDMESTGGDPRELRGEFIRLVKGSFV